jgi:hypothetical protein
MCPEVIIVITRNVNVVSIEVKCFHSLRVDTSNSCVICRMAGHCHLRRCCTKARPCPLCDHPVPVDTVAASQSFEVRTVQHSITGLSSLTFFFYG